MAKKAERAFSKTQILGSSKFSDIEKDVIKVVLDNDNRYSISRVKAEIEKILKTKIRSRGDRS